MNSGAVRNLFDGLERSGRECERRRKLDRGRRCFSDDELSGEICQRQCQRQGKWDVEGREQARRHHRRRRCRVRRRSRGADTDDGCQTVVVEGGGGNCGASAENKKGEKESYVSNNNYANSHQQKLPTRRISRFHFQNELRKELIFKAVEQKQEVSERSHQLWLLASDDDEYDEQCSSSGAMEYNFEDLVLSSLFQKKKKEDDHDDNDNDVVVGKTDVISYNNNTNGSKIRCSLFTKMEKAGRKYEQEYLKEKQRRKEERKMRDATLRVRRRVMTQKFQ